MLKAAKGTFAAAYYKRDGVNAFMRLPITTETEVGRRASIKKDVS